MRISDWSSDVCSSDLLGRWALNTACQQLAEWHRTISAASRIQMSVNVSGIQLARDDVVEAVRAALTGSGLPGEHLKIELTESAIIDNPESTKRVPAALTGLDRKRTRMTSSHNCAPRMPYSA